MWRQEGSDLVRAVAGGFLFGVPLLYTIEVWWYGSWVHPRWVLGALLVSLVVVTALNRTAGFRDARDVTWRDAAMDGVEIVAIALACAAAVLVCLREITAATSLREAVGKTVFEAVPFAVGAALARPLLGRKSDEHDERDEQERPSDPAPGDEAIGRTLADAGAAAIGALVLSFAIAPTDEIPALASAITPAWLLALVAMSLLVSYGIVFQADFSNQSRRRRHEGLFQQPLVETAGAYVISLLVAALMLLFFQRIGPSQSWETWVTWTVVLGLPATVGGAAGRLAV